MGRFLAWLPALVVPAALVVSNAAARVLVPDDYPTIQAAINSGADTVAVRDGLVPERLTLQHHVVIEPASYHALFEWVAMPSIRSLEVVDTCLYGCFPEVAVRGVRFLGEVRNDARRGSISFESCRFDSGYASPYQSYYLFSTIRGCLFFEDISVSGYLQFNGNTVIGATVLLWADGLHDVRNNYIQGPGDGLKLQFSASTGPVSGNIIRGSSDGIRVMWADGGTRVSNNDIADCSGHGIVYEANIYTVNCDSNLVARCGGSGIRAERLEPFGSASITGNVVRETGDAGIDASESMANPIDRNVVIGTGGDGIAVWAGQLSGNVVGQSQGTGIRISNEGYLIRGNTVFSCAGAGIQLGGYGDSLSLNLCAFNAGPGFLYEGAAIHALPKLICNDWFANGGGATIGMAPGSTDLQLDPLFCSLANADVHLAANSVLLTGAGCGLIGALGEGCAATASVEGDLALEPLQFRAWPVPARGRISFHVPRIANGIRIEVFDIMGALRWKTEVADGATRVEWNGQGFNGQMIPAGVYFARLGSLGSTLGTTRIVIAQ